MKTVGLAACAVLIMTSSAAAQKPPADATLRQRINAYLAPLAAHQLSGTLLVARGGRVVVERSFGWSDVERQVPFTPETPSAIASITKPMTVIIATQLMDAHRLSPNDTVSRWLPEYKAAARMTVLQLLNHSAGVPHRLLPDDMQAQPRTAAEMVRIANQSELLFEPGAKSVYSSGGYSLLAAILERAGGATFDTLLQTYVTKPAHATHTHHANAQQILPGRALSFLPAGDVTFNAPLRDLSFLVGAGSVYATPRDIFAIMQVLLGGGYGASARESLLRPNGLDWNGVTNGYRAFADYHSADSLTVIFCGNAHTGAIDLLRFAIPRLARGETVAPPTIPSPALVALGDAARRRLEGDYDTGGGSISPVRFVTPTVALFGDRALAAVNDSTLFSYADYALVTFKAGPDGSVQEIAWGPGTWGRGEAGPTFPRKLPSR